MTRATKGKAKEPSALLNLVHSSTSAPSSTSCQPILYNPYSLMPLCWPPVIQSLDSNQQQHQPQSLAAMPSSMPLGTSVGLDNLGEHENSASLTIPKAPFYMFPYPCFFPLPDVNGFQHPSAHQQNVPDRTSVVNQCTSASSSPKNITDVNDSWEAKVKTEVSRFIDTDLNKSPVECSLYGHVQCGGPHPKEMPNAPMLLDSVGTKFMAKHENGFKSDCAINIDVKPSAASPSVNSSGARNQESLSHSNKKLVDAVMAAEARRRRKELTKLKNSHGRQVRMHL